jgi:predicted nucleotidyltransferase
MDSHISQNIAEIQQLMRNYGVERAFLFGSAARGEMHPGSDVDFIIRFPGDMDFVTYADNYFALAHDLEKLLQHQVDLVAEETLQNKYLIESIESHKVQVL